MVEVSIPLLPLNPIFNNMALLINYLVLIPHNKMVLLRDNIGILLKLL